MDHAGRGGGSGRGQLREIQEPARAMRPNECVRQAFRQVPRNAPTACRMAGRTGGGGGGAITHGWLPAWLARDTYL